MPQMYTQRRRAAAESVGAERMPESAGGLPPEVLASLRPTPTVRPAATPVPDVTLTPDPTYKGYIDGVDSTVNVRSGPGTNYDILGTLKKKDTVLIYSLEENWYCIDFNGTKGYVHKQYVAFDNNEE